MAKQVTQYDYLGYMTGATKGTPAVITLGPNYRPIPRVQVNDYVHIAGTGWASLNGTRQVTAVDVAAGTITVAADTTAEVGTVNAAGIVAMHN